MRPDGLMNCMSERKRLLQEKESEMNSCFRAIEKVKEKLDIIDSFTKVSIEVKSAMRDSLERELKEIKNDMYELVESIELGGLANE
jgi:uncharacterized coiled-coil DUF342 family protein